MGWQPLPKILVDKIALRNPDIINKEKFNKSPSKDLYKRVIDNTETPTVLNQMKVWYLQLGP